MMDGTIQQIKRCAIYTRKSHSDGLDQEFNSIDAQHESAMNYIKLQSLNNWVAVDDTYDDPAFSGGSIERPALKRLMTDIEKGHIDVVIVYKIDRLSRSLMDFAQLMGLFEQHNVSFVSVTQDFNTSNSMGRLILNILLSFAQFEREVTAERIRDKMAASKKKGFWMGGAPPLGYDVKDKKLIVNEKESQIVQRIFNRFLEMKSSTRLVQELLLEGVTTKTWKTKNNKTHNGRPISKGFIYKLLQNPVYLGKTSHKGELYEGKHNSIIDQETWDSVHKILKDRTRKTKSIKPIPFLLQSILFDQDGYALTPFSTQKKGGKRYRYYISSRDAKNYTGASGLPRFQAAELEQTVFFYLRKLLRSEQVIKIMGNHLPELDEAKIAISMNKVDKIWEHLLPKEQQHITQMLINRIIVSAEMLEIIFHKNGIEKVALEMKLPDTMKSENANTSECSDIKLIESNDGSVSLLIPFKVRSRKNRKIIQKPDGSSVNHTHDEAITPLQTALIRGVEWEQMLIKGEASSLKEIAEIQGIDPSYVSRMVNLTMLSPYIISCILNDTISDKVTLEDLAIGTPYLWCDQYKKIGLS